MSTLNENRDNSPRTMDMNKGDNKQLGANRYSNQDYSQGYDRVDHHNLEASQDKKEDKMTHLQMMLMKNKPSVQVEVEVVDVQESRYK